MTRAKGREPPTVVRGRVTRGYGLAGRNFATVLRLIETRSGLSGLIPNTLNLKLREPFFVVPDFVVTGAEYFSREELRFRHCRIASHRCLIVRPDSHELGAAHGPAHLEIMSSVWLRSALGLEDGDRVDVHLG